MPQLTAPLLIVTGPPGAGKTTVARRLAEATAKGVHLEADTFWQSIRTGWVPPWLPESREQNEVVVDVVSRAALGYTLGGYSVVVDGIVGPWFLERFADPLIEAGISVHYVVLRPAAAAALGRATARGTDALTRREPIEKMYDAFCQLGVYERNVLDSTALTADQTVVALRVELSSGRFALPPRS